jgi:C3HC4-type zinc finger (RING finger) protein
MFNATDECHPVSERVFFIWATVMVFLYGILWSLIIFFHFRNKSIKILKVRAKEALLKLPVLPLFKGDSVIDIPELQCFICYKNKVCVAFNCTHTMCYGCSTKFSKCPLCRSTIKLRMSIRIP